MTFPFENLPTDLRMPAEWEKHHATWLSWPVNTDTWPLYDKYEAIPWVFADIVKALHTGEKVRINVENELLAQRASDFLDKKGCSLKEVEFFYHKSNDAWCRDHGPIFVKNTKGETIVTNWEYNAWGGKYPPFHNDNEIPAQIAKHFSYPMLSAGIVMEGGSLEVNGKGTLLTTKACLLNQNRNPHLSQAQIEQYLSAFLGIKHFLWLEDGIVGDDTDGHIDDLTRFVDEHTVVTIVEHDKNDDNYHLLKENSELLSKMKDQDGKSLNIIELPMPAPVWREGNRLPASYANFYIGNQTVIVPIFGDKMDDIALNTLQSCFPTRKVVGIYCRDLVWGLGTLHCVTQQEPA